MQANARIKINKVDTPSRHLIKLILIIIMIITVIIMIIIMIITIIIIIIIIINFYPETRKYWVDVQRGIVLSHGERDPL